MEIKKYTGFTLIELLAVIVILAVIALIATPIIMNVINDSKEGAAKDAMYGYVKAVELASAKQISPTMDAPDGDYTTENGNLKKGSEILEITFKGTKPADNGTVKISKGNVISATLVFDEISVAYDGKEAGELKEYVVGEEIYFDPTGTVTDCASGKEWTPSNTGTTCYKWNILKDNGNNIEMLLNHNTTVRTTWTSSGSKENGPLEVYNQLKIDTSGWNRVETLTSSDSVTRNDGIGGTYTINYNGMKARLISGQELADIVNDTTWVASGDTSLVISSAPWLYQNLSHSITATMSNGYWTDTAEQSKYNNAWYVNDIGYLGRCIFKCVSNLGVRPVVRVLKSNI